MCPLILIKALSYEVAKRDCVIPPDIILLYNQDRL